MTNKPSIDDLWLEMRVASQYADTWDKAEDNIELVRRKELAGNLPNQDDLAGLSSFSARKGSPAKWMTWVDAPGWFKRDELGYGSGINYWSTQFGLGKANKQRAKKHEAMLKSLVAAAKASVISRTRKMAA